MQVLAALAAALVWLWEHRFGVFVTAWMLLSIGIGAFVGLPELSLISALAGSFPLLLLHDVMNGQGAHLPLAGTVPRWQRVVHTACWVRDALMMWLFVVGSCWVGVVVSLWVVHAALWISPLPHARAAPVMK